MKKFLARLLFAGIFSLGVSKSFGARASDAEASRPALWSVSDADTNVYLFGTIHVLKLGCTWRGSVVDDALRSRRLADRIKTPGVIFADVGAGHLVGPDSLQSMLASNENRVSRLQ